MLSVSDASRADEPAAPQGAELTLKLSDHPELSKIGGAEIIKNGDESIIVARTGADEFVALSAICTHRGCLVKYDGKQFICPCHDSRFGLDGRVLKGPARTPLQAFGAEENLLIRKATPKP